MCILIAYKQVDETTSIVYGIVRMRVSTIKKQKSEKAF